MAISLLFLIFLISIPLTSATSPSSTLPPTPQDPSPPHQVLILPPILSSLGYITLASALPSLSSPILSSWNGPVTLFAPSDSSLHSCLHSSCTPLRLLRDHIVPGLFPLQSLLSLPFSSKLSTASPGRCLTLTSTSALNSSNPNPKLFVNGLEITKPDLFNNGQVVIHGIQGFIAPLSPFSCLHHVPPPRRVPGLVTGSVVPLMLEDTISRLHKNGYGFVALAMRVKYPELVSLNNMTIFALTDGAIFTGGAHEYVTEVRFHIVPDQLMSHEDLIKLPTGTVLPTLVQGQHLIVTHGLGSGSGSVGAVGSGLFSINYVPVKDPDVVINSRVAVHGLIVPFPRLYLADAMANGLEIMRGTGESQEMCRARLATGQCNDMVVATGPVGPAAAPAEAGATTRVRLMGFGDDGL
ncbi:fasciclin-like arabinogalactan protein 21 [Carex rostrata]